MQQQGEPEDVMLSEISQTSKDGFCVILFRRGLRVFKSVETESRTGVARGCGEGDGE